MTKLYSNKQTNEKSRAADSYPFVRVGKSPLPPHLGQMHLSPGIQLGEQGTDWISILSCLSVATVVLLDPL